MNFENKKYTLSLHWIIRHDKKLLSNYWAYNVFYGRKIKLSKSLYNILYILKYNSISIKELSEITKYRFSEGELTKILLENENLKGVIQESPNPFRIKSESQSAQIEDLYEGVAITNFPVDAEIHLTERCNLICKHCGYSCSPNSIIEELDYQDWFHVFDQFEEGNLTKLILSGGEVFLYKYIVKY